MLRSAREMFGYSILASEGEIGKVYNFYFDDGQWTVRYLVAETGSWLNTRRVLLSTAALGEPDWSRRVFAVKLTREQVRDSPETDTDMPVSRQQQVAMNTYYGWPSYWAYPGNPHPFGAPGTGDPDLRSIREVAGYGVRATDGDIGHVHDFIVDDDTWAVRYAVLDLLNWLPGKKVLLPPGRIGSVDWAGRKLSATLPCDTIASAPEYGPSPWVDRILENWTYQHYGDRGYWEEA